MQKKVFALCWCAYAGGYLCRTNLSIVIPSLIQDLGWDKASIGLMGSLFFWTYAFGQLINGYIGDRVNPRIFIFISLFSSSLINIVLGFVFNRSLFIVLWAINGFLLSMLWGPIIRILGLWFLEWQRNKISSGISTSMFVSYLIYWSPIGRLIRDVNWRLAFYLPGIAVLLFSFYWLKSIPFKPAEIEKKSSRSEKLSLRELLTLTLFLIAIACLVQGMVKESIGLWTPTILKETFGEDIPLFTMFIPFMSLIGLFFAGWINHKNKNRDELSVLILYLINLAVCVVLSVVLRFNAILSIFLLGVSSALLYGANVLLLANIPLRFAKRGSASTVAGFLDFFSYMGSALASILTGIMATNLGWNKVILSWGILLVIGMASIYQSQKGDVR